MSLPQRISQVIAPIKMIMMARMILVMILRFLDTGFFTFFGFLGLLSVLFGLTGFSLASSLPVSSSKLKTWVGCRKSVALAMDED